MILLFEHIFRVIGLGAEILKTPNLSLKTNKQTWENEFQKKLKPSND